MSDADAPRVAGEAVASAGVPRSTTLLARLRPPSCPAHHVRRERLLRGLDDAAALPLTLVIAPAGSGKTVLLAAWAAETPTACAWLSLDDTERLATRIWEDVARTIDHAHPGLGLDLSRRERGGQQQPGDAAEWLLNELEPLDCPSTVLVLDDLHLVERDAALAEAVGTFLLNLPAWLHVVATSRREPALPVDRLRARGQVAEVRFADLRMSDDEATEMLDRLSPGLDGDEVRATVERADGWAAGLQIAAIAARTARARGTIERRELEGEQMVADYVSREVLVDEDPLIAQVLIETSVVPRMDDGLAQALTGRADARALLEEAAARGLFVSRIGGAGYAVHNLVRDALLAELTRSSGDRLRTQHALAAAWFESAAEVPEALDHYLAAGRHRDALRLLADQHPGLYDAGLESVTRRTIERIPQSVVAGDFEALLEYAWCHLLVDRRRFVELVGHATWVSGSADAPGLQPRVDMLLSIAMTAAGEWAEGGAIARRVIERAGADWWRDSLVRFGWNMSCREFALSERWDESADEIVDARLALVGDPERLVAMEGTRAMGLALAGHPLDALRTVAGIEHVCASSGMSILRVELGLASAIAHRELGDAAGAESELRALAGRPADTLLYGTLRAVVELAHAAIDAGDGEVARSWLARADEIVEHEAFGSGGRAWVAHAQARLALRDGDLVAARGWAAEMSDPFWTPILEARASISEGDRTAASDRAAEAAARCVRHEVVAGVVRSMAAAEPDDAAKHLARAVEHAASQGLLQTIAAEGPDVVERVELVSWNVPQSWMDRLRRVTVGHLRPSTGSAALDSLTPRERELLRYLQSRLTNREIASELYISLNTLKSHLKTIYRKLDVGSRSEAVAVAKDARPH